MKYLNLILINLKFLQNRVANLNYFYYNKSTDL